MRCQAANKQVERAVMPCRERHGRLLNCGARELPMRARRFVAVRTLLGTLPLAGCTGALMGKEAQMAGVDQVPSSPVFPAARR